MEINTHHCISCLSSIWVIPVSKIDLFPIARNSWCFWKNKTQCTQKSNTTVPWGKKELDKFCSSATNRSFSPFTRNALVYVARLLLFSRVPTYLVDSAHPEPPRPWEAQENFLSHLLIFLCLFWHPFKEPPQGVGWIQAVYLTRT